ncbi:hypothetical protein GGR53DRAFT_16783 [Hypoxylon sp. FL1150]|nr:hypothetical protein GGR53DRAFT_16783 [Hypoxylon sp. FL1150]
MGNRWSGSALFALLEWCLCTSSCTLDGSLPTWGHPNNNFLNLANQFPMALLPSEVATHRVPLSGGNGDESRRGTSASCMSSLPSEVATHRVPLQDGNGVAVGGSRPSTSLCCIGLGVASIRKNSSRLTNG